jgi:chemotaxis protein methyltransferase WspC
MNEIQQHLRNAIGLDSQSLGIETVYRTVRQRMHALGLKSFADYEALLADSPPERAELIESVLVLETWFFRDPAAFAALVHLALERERAVPSLPPLRLLSLPCSSGEEPFSATMALREAGVPFDRFHIDAVDISTRALTQAKTAVYGKNSFRGCDPAFRSRHFRPVEEGFALDLAVRDHVRFAQANLFSNDFLVKQGPYDFIFCRNLLIYCDPPTQQRALEILGRLLAPTGLLFVGPAEYPVALAHGFASANLPMAFACHKAGRTPAHAAGLQRPTRYPGVHADLPMASEVEPETQQILNPKCLTASAKVEVSTPRTPQSINPLPSSAAPPDALARAESLADAGRLAEATVLCEEHLRQCRPSARAYYLLGLVREAAGDSRAYECYRKALYLQPDYYEALLQMALWAQKNGDSSSAQTFRRRAQRVHARAAAPARKSKLS